MDHASDCATNSGPAEPAGPCDCIDGHPVLLPADAVIQKLAVSLLRPRANSEAEKEARMAGTEATAIARDIMDEACLPEALASVDGALRRSIAEALDRHAATKERNVEHWLKSEIAEAHKVLDAMGVPDRKPKRDAQPPYEIKDMSLGLPERINWLRAHWRRSTD